MLRQQHGTAARRKEKPRSGGEKAHGVCRPGRDTAARRKKLFWHPFCALQKGWKSSGEDFIGLYEAAAAVCVDSRFAKPRIFLKKVLIVAVRSCGCGVLVRGLRNLGASRKGNEFILFACTKRTKSTPKVCEPLDSGDDSNRRSIRDFR